MSGRMKPEDAAAQTRVDVSSASVGRAATEVKACPNSLRMCHLVNLRWYADRVR